MKELAHVNTLNEAELFSTFMEGIQPPSDQSAWQWLEHNYEIAPGNAMPGKVSFDLFPAAKLFHDYAQNFRTRQMTVKKCSQSTFTENCAMHLAWRLIENPVPTFWVTSTGESALETAKDRIYPAFENCKPVSDIMPKEREFWTRNYLKLPTMSLFMRGANSLKRLTSTPIGLIICDERRDWKKGAIGAVRKRLTTFSDRLEISIGAAGVKGDELDVDFESGSQTFLHFSCPHCGTSQPWRFGQEPSTSFPTPRKCGGVVWPTNDETKPKGQWDLSDSSPVIKLARYECENEMCRHQFTNADKPEMIRSTHEHHRNPKALPHHWSVEVSTLMMPWEYSDFGNVALRFLRAKEAQKHGDIHPLFTFITEDLGESFERPDAHKMKGDLLLRIGDYKMEEFWIDKTKPMDVGGFECERGSGQRFELEKDSVLVITFDRQLLHNWVVIRQWRTKKGESRLVWCGRITNYDGIRDRQLLWRIRDSCVFGDDAGPSVGDFRQYALQKHWTPLKGEDAEYFTVIKIENGKEVRMRQGFNETRFDPGIGTTREGRASIKAFLISVPWYKDKLYFTFVSGKGPLWEIPKDTPIEYFEQMNSNFLDTKINARGETELYWRETSDPHLADCEMEQVAIADMGGLTRYLPPLEKPKPEPIVVPKAA